jgi:protein-tyrosine phosphatase
MITFQKINLNELYNLYNEEASFLDFRKDPKNKINLSLIVDKSNFIETLNEFQPDNLNHLVIIASALFDKQKILYEIKTKFRFKNFYYFDQRLMNKLYVTYPILFNGDIKTYPSLITYLLPKKVFLGSVKTVTNEFLETNNIDTVINLCFTKLNFGNEYNYQIQDSDTQDISSVLDQTFNIIDNSKNILIICEKGQSRSVSVVLHYYIKKFNLSFDKGLNDLKNCRSICRPNDGFIFQIQQKIQISDRNFT